MTAPHYELVIGPAGMRLGMPMEACTPERFCELAASLATQLGYADGRCMPAVLAQAVPGVTEQH